MSDREYTILDAFTYCFNSFSILTDGDHDPDEIAEIRRITREWIKDLSNDDFINSMKKTTTWFLEDLNNNQVGDTLGILVNHFDEVMTDGQKKAFVNDLERIGKADGEYIEDEKNMVQLFRELFEVN